MASIQSCGMAGCKNNNYCYIISQLHNNKSMPFKKILNVLLYQHFNL